MISTVGIACARLAATLFAPCTTVAMIGGWSMQAEPVMFAHFVDVEQANCTQMEFPFAAVKIDAGTQDHEQVRAFLGSFIECGRPWFAGNRCETNARERMTAIDGASNQATTPDCSTSLYDESPS